MKKILLFLLVLCFGVNMFACNVKQDSDTGLSSDSEQYESILQTNGNEQNSDFVESPSTDVPIIDIPLMSFYSFSDYKKFLSESQLPSDFVTYDKMAQIGEFDSLIFLSDAYRNDYSWYLYSFIDANGCECNLYVEHNVNKNKDELAKKESITDVNSEDMRTISEKKTCIYYESDDIIYRYVNGSLLSVEWYDNEIYYTLCGTMMLSDYPSVDGSTFAGKILNTNTVTQALEELMKNTAD